MTGASLRDTSTGAVDLQPQIDHDMSDTVANPFLLVFRFHRNNSKLREKAKKDEGKRLREFVDAAYRLDTRILRRKENQMNERSVMHPRPSAYCWAFD